MLIPNVSNHSGDLNVKTLNLFLCSLGLEIQVKKIEMNYANYNMAIVEHYKVKLIGWTYDKFVNPSLIGTMPDICMLRDALKSGECRWIKLDRHQLQAHRDEIKKRQENGEC